MPPPPPESVPGRRAPWLRGLMPLAWAAYLASSWTWCIGMFLPVLLVRDYGPWAFVIFAVPNILGAGGIGWVLRDAAASRWIVARHGRAAVWFSCVTIVFQTLFAVYMGQLAGEILPEFSGRFLVLAVATTCGGALFAGPGIGVTAWGISLGLFVTYLAQADWPPPAVWGATAARHSEGAGGGSPASLVWLAPVMCFGFLLCPYLDLTFHKVRSSLGVAAGRVAFGLGFGLLFTAMILFTLAYSGEFFGRGLGWRDGTVAIVLAHVVLQASYTAGIHLRAIATSPRGDGRGGGPRSLAWWTGIGAVCMMLLIFGGVWRGAGMQVSLRLRIELEFELIYRVFMAFYGLVFPAYVWLCVIPTRDGHSGPSRAKVLIWAGAVGIAAPMFWMGFIERHMGWLGPGLGVVLAARLLLPRRSGDEEPDRRS